MDAVNISAGIVVLILLILTGPTLIKWGALLMKLLIDAWVDVFAGLFRRDDDPRR